MNGCSQVSPLNPSNPFKCTPPPSQIIYNFGVIPNHYLYPSCFFSQKYPEFAKYFIEEFEKAACCICKEHLQREQLILSNPCAHYFCASCACQMIKIWNEEGRLRPKCPICRAVLRDHLFAKPGFFSATRLHQCSLFVWVPTSTYIHSNFNQSMVEALTSRNFTKAFYYSFIMNTTRSSDVEKVLAPTWSQYYEDRRRNLTCTTCNLPINFAQAFGTKCGHFYCTICAAYSTSRPRVSPMLCPICDEDIEDETMEIIFMRPIQPPTGDEWVDVPQPLN